MRVACENAGCSASEEQARSARAPGNSARAFRVRSPSTEPPRTARREPRRPKLLVGQESGLLDLERLIGQLLAVGRVASGALSPERRVRRRDLRIVLGLCGFLQVLGRLMAVLGKGHGVGDLLLRPERLDL